MKLEKRFEEIKEGFEHYPFKTLWRLSLLPVVLLTACLFAFVLAVFHLRLDEVRKFFDQLI